MSGTLQYYSKGLQVFGLEAMNVDFNDVEIRMTS